MLSLTLFHIALWSYSFLNRLKPVMLVILTMLNCISTIWIFRWKTCWIKSPYKDHFQVPFLLLETVSKNGEERQTVDPLPTAWQWSGEKTAAESRPARRSRPPELSWWGLWAASTSALKWLRARDNPKQHLGLLSRAADIVWPFLGLSCHISLWSLTWVTGLVGSRHSSRLVSRMRGESSGYVSCKHHRVSSFIVSSVAWRENTKPEVT